MQIRKQTWAIAALFLIVFCWLGYAAVSFGALFKGLDMNSLNLPVATEFAVAHGSVAFPIFGIVAATAFLLFDLWIRKRWAQWILSALFTLLIIWAVRGLFAGFIGPAIQTMK